MHAKIKFVISYCTGSAAALQDVDTVFTQYREVGVFLWRGFTLQDVMHQCFSTHKVFQLSEH